MPSWIYTVELIISDLNGVKYIQISEEYLKIAIDWP